MEQIISSKRYSIKGIFQKNWEWYFAKHKNSIPEDTAEAITKMLSCRDPEKLGYHKFECPAHPEQTLLVPNSCKSRFCNPCGKVFTDKWVSKIEKDFPSVSFHHITFTIPSELRELLEKYNFLADALFTASSQTVLSFAKENLYVPAIISCFHSFGRNLKIHPHIHMLVTAGGISLKKKTKNYRWHPSFFFPFKMLHKRFRFLFIKHIKKAIKKYLQKHPDCGELTVFKNPKVMDLFFDSLLEIDWYVYDSTPLPPENFTVSYITRYTKRPPLAECRILYYGKIPEDNYTDNWVCFSYKERNKPEAKWTLRVEEFITILIRHIPPKNFRQVRYSGILANRTKSRFKKELPRLFRRQESLIKATTWRERVIATTGKDPLRCPICQKEMELVEVVYFSKKSGELVSYSPRAP